MSDTGSDIDRMAPQKLLEPFAKGKVVRFVFLALLIHVVVIGAFSTRYIYYTWIDPEAGKALKEAEEREAAEAEKGHQAVTGSPAASNGTAIAGSTNTPQSQGSVTSDKELVEKHGDKPVVKAITETATPDEIPKAPTPDGLGISLDDTN